MSNSAKLSMNHLNHYENEFNTVLDSNYFMKGVCRDRIMLNSFSDESEKPYVRG